MKLLGFAYILLLLLNFNAMAQIILLPDVVRQQKIFEAKIFKCSDSSFVYEAEKYNVFGLPVFRVKSLDGENFDTVFFEYDGLHRMSKMVSHSYVLTKDTTYFYYDQLPRLLKRQKNYRYNHFECRFELTLDQTIVSLEDQYLYTISRNLSPKNHEDYFFEKKLFGLLEGEADTIIYLNSKLEILYKTYYINNYEDGVLLGWTHYKQMPSGRKTVMDKWKKPSPKSWARNYSPHYFDPARRVTKFSTDTIYNESNLITKISIVSQSGLVANDGSNDFIHHVNQDGKSTSVKLKNHSKCFNYARRKN